MGYDEVARDQVGDIRYSAPEMIQGRPYNFKVDSWSFGIILFFLMSGGLLPFDEGRSNDAMRPPRKVNIKKKVFSRKILNR